MIHKQAQTKLVKNSPLLKPNNNLVSSRQFVRDSFLVIFYRCRNTYLMGLGTSYLREVLKSRVEGAGNFSVRFFFK